MKGLHFHISKEFEMGVYEYETSIRFTYDEVAKAKHRITSAKPPYKYDKFTAYDPHVELTTPDTFMYLMQSFPPTTNSETGYVINGVPTIVTTSPEFKNYMSDAVKWQGVVYKCFCDNTDKIGYDFNTVEKAVVYQRNTLESMITAQFEKKFALEKLVLLDSKDTEKIQFLMDNEDRVVKALSKTDSISHGCEFDKKAFDNFIKDRELVQKYKGSYELNKYLAEKYTFEKPSIYLLKLYDYLEVGEYQHSQHINGELSNMWKHIRPLLAGYPDAQEISAAKSIFQREDEDKEIPAEFANLPHIRTNVMDMVVLKHDHPEFLDHLRMV